MNLSLLLTVENSRPEISRCINVDSQLHLGDLAHVMNAALGFSGHATHLFVLPSEGDGADRAVYTTVPGAGEYDEEDLCVEDLPESLSYVYDTSANWNVHVEVLGVSAIDGPTPILIHATGPDVIEAVGGPDMMTRFHREAQRLAAGLEPSMDITPAMFAHVPVMAPAHMVECLSNAHPVTISGRISFVAEEFIYNDFSQLPDGTPAPTVDEISDFLESREDLQEIMALDPNPSSNPDVLAAVAQFLDTNYPQPPFERDREEDYEKYGVRFTEFYDRLCYWLMRNTGGNQPSSDDIYAFLVNSGLLMGTDPERFTALGEEVMLKETLSLPLIKQLHKGFAATFGEEIWNKTLEFYLDENNRTFVIDEAPRYINDTIPLLTNMGLVEWGHSGTISLRDRIPEVLRLMQQH